MFILFLNVYLDPLVPEKVDNDPGIPELRKREPSRYRYSGLDSRRSAEPKPQI